MNETPRTNGRRTAVSSKNGRMNGAVTNGRKNGVAHRTNGSAVAGGKAAALEQPRQVTSLLLSIARELFAMDDVVSDLPLRQLRVCGLLHEGPLSMSALSRELGVSLSAMTQIADRLERARLVKRLFEGTDRRVRCLQLTARGQRIMRLRENARVQRASTILRRLPSKEQTEVVTALESLLGACTAAKH